MPQLATTMDQKQKPCVLIRTYGQTFSPASNENHHHQKRIDFSQVNGNNKLEEATKQDRSTNLFTNNRSHRRFNETSNDVLISLQLPPREVGGKLDDFASINNGPSVKSSPRIECSRFAKFYLNQIKGPSGSVRGHRDVVRRSLENIRSAAAAAAASQRRNFNAAQLASFVMVSQQEQEPEKDPKSAKQWDRLYYFDCLSKLIEEEEDKCVAYTTTLGVMRRTFEDSKLMKSILSSNLIRFEERDIYLNQEYKQQLRLRCNSILVPALFVGGQHFAGIKELEFMNESGTLPYILANFKMPKASNEVCLCCGNARFIACQSCHGSRKSTIHHFKFNSIALRCIKCDKNGGLVQCPICTTKNNNEYETEIEGDINNNNER